jgi:adenylylsulfate kinase-like enzyme
MFKKSRAAKPGPRTSREGAYCQSDRRNQAFHRKAICFVTGVPGSGKTLAGLNIATERMRSSEDEHAVFLSGNGPLVAVLREARKRRGRPQQSPTALNL